MKKFVNWLKWLFWVKPSLEEEHGLTEILKKPDFYPQYKPEDTNWYPSANWFGDLDVLDSAPKSEIPEGLAPPPNSVEWDDQEMIEKVQPSKKRKKPSKKSPPKTKKKKPARKK